MFDKLTSADLKFFAEIGLTTGETAAALNIAAITARKYSKKFNVRFPNKPSSERRFHKSYEIVSESGCWIWTGADRGNGYGCMMEDNILISAHRKSYEMYYGAIPSGMIVCHRCDVPSCVNPDHLFIGTHKDNHDDMAKKGRNNPPRGDEHWTRRRVKNG